MTVLGGSVSKSLKKIAGKGAEQYMLRLPSGLRNSVARRADENGRSMNTEIIEAIEKHLEGADRVTELWENFGKHRENIEALDAIRGAVEALERAVSGLTEGEFYGRLTEMREDAERKARAGISRISDKAGMLTEELAARPGPVASLPKGKKRRSNDK
jgi:Arc-like DNA binding domain